MKFYQRHSAAVNKNIMDCALALPVEVSPQSQHILRRAFFITASQRHVDRFEIEAGGLDSVQIFDGAARHS